MRRWCFAPRPAAAARKAAPRWRAPTARRRDVGEIIARRPLSRRHSRFFPLSGPGCRAAFHMFELFVAQRFPLGLPLAEIGARCRSGGLFLALGRTPARKQATQKIRDHNQQTPGKIGCSSKKDPAPPLRHTRITAAPGPTIAGREGGLPARRVVSGKIRIGSWPE
jgi:hypothetical protein